MIRLADGPLGLRLRRSTRRRRRSYVASGMALLVGLLAAVGSPSAHAGPVDMAPQHYSKATRDGWNLNISIEGQGINSVPNLAAAANSREAFVTLGDRDGDRWNGAHHR
ncbi:MAG: hypothetical protein QOI25_2385 [Mycobacterium sp.]|nr:hypothetical protein [Mycobacterium sp.]